MPRKTFKKKITDEKYEPYLNKINEKLFIRFLKYKDATCSDKTIKQYRSNLKIFSTWNYLESDNEDYFKIKRIDMADFFNYAVLELKWGSARYSNMRSCLSSLGTYIKKFYYEDYPMFDNYINDVIDSLPKLAVREKTILSVEQVESLMKYIVEDIKSKREACLLSLAISSGARVSELLRFDLDIINEDNTAFDGIFLKTTTRIKTKGFGKQGEAKYKFIIKDLFLPYYHEWLKERAEIMTKNNQSHNKLFIKNDGTPVKVSTVNSWKNQWENYLNVPIYFHAFRHYITTYLSKIGLDQELIVHIMGWKSADMYNIYNDLSAEDKEWKNLSKLKDALAINE